MVKSLAGRRVRDNEWIAPLFALLIIVFVHHSTLLAVVIGLMGPLSFSAPVLDDVPIHFDLSFGGL